jgi:hypothetical protein
MSRDAERELVNFIAQVRPYDWSKAMIRAAIRRTVMQYGGDYSAVEIGQAALHVAGNPLADSPDAIWRPGPHWENLPKYLRTGTGGRRFATQHDRELVEDGRAAQVNRDPEKQRAWREAALAAAANPAS